MVGSFNLILWSYVCFYIFLFDIHTITLQPIVYLSSLSFHTSQFPQQTLYNIIQYRSQYSNVPVWWGDNACTQTAMYQKLISRYKVTFCERLSTCSSRHWDEIHYSTLLQEMNISLLQNIHHSLVPCIQILFLYKCYSWYVQIQAYEKIACQQTVMYCHSTILWYKQNVSLANTLCTSWFR